MSSLPNSFTYGSASSVHSIKDAFASYCRSQYYPTSNVRPSNLTDDVPPLSVSVGPLDPIDGPSAESHPQYTGLPPPHASSPYQFIRAYGDHESTPLLRKAASFTVFSANSARAAPTSGCNIVPQDPALIHPPVIIEHHSGKSTYGQTLFNCIAVLSGIGMLSEPLAFAYAGWLWGTVLIVSFGLITCYTAKFVAHEILDDPRLRSYADIGRKAFGPKSSLLTNILFCLELFSLSVVLVTLAADSLEGIWPAYSANTYKVFLFFLLAPTVFMPLSILSLASLLGIISTFLIIMVIFVDGFSKSDCPGSLWSPAVTSISPGTLGEVGVAFGLFMAGFSGHVVIPSLARDMRDPSQFDHMANRAFLIATIIYAVIGCAGYIMFGSSVSDEISRDLLATPGYNSALNQLVMWLLVITPLSKFALSTRPLNIILENMLGSDITTPTSSVRDGKGLGPEGPQTVMNRFLVAFERIMVPVMSILVSILVPQFSSLMAFLGSFSAFVICVIGPISAKIAMTGRCKWYDATVLCASILMAVWGTFSALWTT